MINRSELLVNENKVDDSVGITIAKKNVELKRVSAGELILENEFGERFCMYNVVYVPDLVTNLLSVRKLRENGYDIEFGEQVKIIRRLTGEVVSNVEEDANGLFTVRFRLVHDYVLNSCESALPATESKSVWHRGLGHPGAKVLFKTQDIELNKNDGLTIATCGVCAKAKQTKNPYDTTQERAKFPLEIVHTDIMGPMNESVDGDKYIVTFLDDHMHYAVTFAMRHQSDVGEHFIPNSTVKL